MVFPQGGPGVDPGQWVKVAKQPEVEK